MKVNKINSTYTRRIIHKNIYVRIISGRKVRVYTNYMALLMNYFKLYDLYSKSLCEFPPPPPLIFL